MDTSKLPVIKVQRRRKPVDAPGIAINPARRARKAALQLLGLKTMKQYRKWEQRQRREARSHGA